MRVIAGTVVLVTAVISGCDGRRLISDQEMIDHFNTHKPEFNALVQTFLHYLTDPMAWSQQPDVVELKSCACQSGATTRFYR